MGKSGCGLRTTVAGFRSQLSYWEQTPDSLSLHCHIQRARIPESATRVVLRLAYRKHQMDVRLDTATGLLQYRPSWESRDTWLPEDMTFNSWHRTWQYSGYRTTCTLKGQLRNEKPGMDVALWVRPAQTRIWKALSKQGTLLPVQVSFSLCLRWGWCHLPHKTVRWMRSHS